MENHEARAGRYHEQEFYDLERKYLWPYAWQMACRAEEVPKIGDWIEYRNIDQSVIVVRTKSGIKAFANACRHRGVASRNWKASGRRSSVTTSNSGWRRM